MSIEIAQTQDIAACHALRREVFIQEQAVPEADELDDLDDQALHVLARIDGAPVGTARILIKAKTAKIGRVCVVKNHRGTGLGAQIMGCALELIRAQNGVSMVQLSSQISANGFYEKLGFHATGDIYLDAGIQHQDMTLQL